MTNAMVIENKYILLIVGCLNDIFQAELSSFGKSLIISRFFFKDTSLKVTKEWSAVALLVPCLVWSYGIKLNLIVTSLTLFNSKIKLQEVLPQISVLRLSISNSEMKLKLGDSIMIFFCIC